MHLYYSAIKQNNSNYGAYSTLGDTYPEIWNILQNIKNYHFCDDTEFLIIFILKEYVFMKQPSFIPKINLDTYYMDIINFNIWVIPFYHWGTPENALKMPKNVKKSRKLYSVANCISGDTFIYT